MKAPSSLSTILLFYFSTLLVSNSNAKLFDSFKDRFTCPDPAEYVAEFPDYDIDCVDASIPPWPMCLFHNVTYFIEASVASASRCCDFDNLELCRCPVKDTTHWRNVMMEWCPMIAKCPMPEGDISMTMMSPLVTDAWTMNIIDSLIDGDFDVEEFDDDGEDGFDDVEFDNYYNDEDEEDEEDEEEGEDDD